MIILSLYRLITTSTPPFCVVNANKAFSMFSGKSNAEVIGKPVESIVQVLQDMCSASNSATSFLESKFQGTNMPCQLRVMPVMDQSRQPQAGMSHLLIKILPSKNNKTTTEVTSRIEKIIPPTNINGGNLHIFGTVG